MKKHTMRRWSIKKARELNFLYCCLEKTLLFLNPIFEKIGYHRLEKPFAFMEKHIKGFLFDCKMCGQCVLSSTGMSCPMNCPKQLRNGPCGGVLQNGNCEVIPSMKCVWVDAYEGAKRIPNGVEEMQKISFAVDYRLFGKSSWLRAVRQKIYDRDNNQLK